jgi:hypothetical protein
MRGQRDAGCRHLPTTVAISRSVRASARPLGWRAHRSWGRQEGWQWAARIRSRANAFDSETLQIMEVALACAWHALMVSGSTLTASFRAEHTRDALASRIMDAARRDTMPSRMSQRELDLGRPTCRPRARRRRSRSGARSGTRHNRKALPNRAVWGRSGRGYRRPFRLTTDSGSDLMSDPAEYRRNARVCADCADAAGSPLDRQIWLRLQLTWLRLAAEAQRMDETDAEQGDRLKRCA